MAIAEGYVNEIASRLGHGGVAPRGHHCTVLPYAPDLKFQIVFTKVDGRGQLETVWTFDAPGKPAMNKRRGEHCRAMLEAATPPHPVRMVSLANDARVGFVFPLPAEPDAGFYDAVAEDAKWVQGAVKPSVLDRVK